MPLLLGCTYVLMACWNLPIRAYTWPMLSRARDTASVRALRQGDKRIVALTSSCSSLTLGFFSLTVPLVLPMASEKRWEVKGPGEAESHEIKVNFLFYLQLWLTP